MAMLQEFHERVTRVVFAHRGTLEKHIGEAMMATFGTPAPEPDDTGRALRCALDLAREMRRWSDQRLAHGDAPVAVGIGLHYGDAVVGSIGDEQRLDYAVVGDTVNVASRLERLTRELDVEIVVSDELVTQISNEGSGADVRLGRLSQRVEVRVPGRVRPISIWTADHR